MSETKDQNILADEAAANAQAESECEYPGDAGEESEVKADE